MITTVAQRWRDQRATYRPAGEPFDPPFGMSPRDVERFDARVRAAGPEECWPFEGGAVRGYGQFSIRRRPHKAHRVAYGLAHGEPPAGLCVCHRCDNPACCNPAHLFLGSNPENTADKVAKGRQARGPKLAALIRTGAPRGEACRSARLTVASVLLIRERHASGGSAAALAAEFGVTPQAVRKVVLRRSWRHV